MTAQARERLLYRGQQMSMCSEPLSVYFRLMSIEPDFAEQSSACWRRYVGSWEVRNEQLYLVELSATMNSGEAACLETLFPGYKSRVFAHWYTGEIRVPQGSLIEQVHMGYSSKYEEDLFMEFKRGILVSTRIVRNVP